MIPNASLSLVILLIVAVVLFYLALTDFKHYKIRNDVILLLVVLFFVHALLSGRWANIPWNIGFSLFILAILIYLYSQNLLGGGDVKLLAVALLWVGLDCALPFALLLLIFTAIHALAARLGWVGSQQIGDDDRPRIAFAPSVAAALIGTFMLGCLHPAP